ncbi:GumC family protein [Granulicella arctica]|uniref:Capsular exopolysaccharide synthesis family protein n=1 Tax=Granulicella arctica TaxID=940613 RepID=A0A7Y9PHF8_9BACT|nr:polysaccharide biosynthesis tyrosine autokinase [Granulicella arctica]NYF79921.1 capsular exopolysaccharide synthesis family protein [Granulicella arctica]
MRPITAEMEIPMLPAKGREMIRGSVGGAHAATEPVFAFSHYLWLMRRHRWTIVAVVVVCTSLAVALSYKLQPMYEATAKIAIDVRATSNVIGEASAPAGAADVDQVFNTEMQLIQSDGVLRPVVERFHLLDSKRPRKLPEGVKFSDAAVSLDGLSVVHPANSLLLNVSYRSADPAQAAAVANAVAHNFLTHSLETRSDSSIEQAAFMEKQLNQLKVKMTNAEQALAGYEKELGVIDPDEKTSMLSARLQQLNTEYTEAENERIRKEADYRALQSGSIAAIGASSQAVNLSKLEDAVHAAEQKMALVKTVYGPEYSEYRRANNELNEVTRQYRAMSVEVGQRMQVEYEVALHREDMLHAALTQGKSEADSLSAQEFRYRQLKDEAEEDKHLYNELFRKVQEAGINGGYQGNAIRIADEARPQLHPVFPNRLVFTFLGMLSSLVISLIVILIVDMMDKTLRDPMQAQLAIGMPVIGILPRVNDFQGLSLAIDRSHTGGTALAKGTSDWFSSVNFYSEAIATLLSCMLLERRGQPLRSLLVTSAAPGEGKSSCVSHLAAAHARQGFRTLLIDADLRRPSLHESFRLTGKMGLVTAILEDKPLSEIRQTVSGIENLDVITAGSSPNLPLNRVGMKVEQILEQARNEYDMVFVDAPPMLCFAEPVQIACAVDGVLIVSRAAETRQQAVSGVLAILERLRVNVVGVVLNQVQEKMSPIYQPYQAYYRKTLELSSKSA